MTDVTLHAEVARLQDARSVLVDLLVEPSLDSGKIADLRRQIADISSRLRRLTEQADPRDYIV